MTPQEALQNVREAHRLIFAYQQRIIDFVYLLRRKLMVNTNAVIEGLKHYSEKIADRKNRDFAGPKYKKNVFSAVRKDAWAWDYLPTYAFEYVLGENILSDNAKTFTSLIQITDDAVYASDEGYCDPRKVRVDKDHMMLDISKHTSANDSHSVFVLACIYTSDGVYNDLWNTSDVELSDFLKSGKSFMIKSKESNRFLLYRFDIEKIFTPEEVEHVISALHKIVCELAPLGWPKESMPLI